MEFDRRVADVIYCCATTNSLLHRFFIQNQSQRTMSNRTIDDKMLEKVRRCHSMSSFVTPGVITF